MNLTVWTTPFEKQAAMKLGALPNFDCYVDVRTLVGDLSYYFKKNPDLPGILISSQENPFCGMISREHYFEALGRPYGVELFSKNTALQFFHRSGAAVLVFDADIHIEDAVKQALSRKGKEIYEPVVVRYFPHAYKIVNMHTLLKAQCDLTEKLYHEVQQLSIKDPLTELSNRRGFFDEAALRIHSANRNQESLSAFMIDIDNFKIVNDIYGHFAGDHVIQSVAREIQKSLRQTDLLGRFGGEEFIALLPNTTLEMALPIAERVRYQVEQHQIFVDGYQITVSVSIGVSHIEQARRSLDVLLSQADQAMYAAKQAGRNQIMAYQNIHLHQTGKSTLFQGAVYAASYEKQSLEAAQIYDETIEGWARALELRDKETKGHAKRVTEMTIELARRFNISEQQLVAIRRGALLHDIGKIAIPDHILFKKGPLSDDEWEVMKKHPIYAYELLSPITFLQDVIDIPYCHHEHWDGSGYPWHLTGEEIPLSASLPDKVRVNM